MYGNLIGDFFKDLEDQEQEKELEEITGKKVEKASDEVNMAVDSGKTEYVEQSADIEDTEDYDEGFSEEDDLEEDLEEALDDFDDTDDFDEDDLEEDLELDEEDLEPEELDDNDFDPDELADAEDDDLEEEEEDTEDFDPDELADEEDDDLEDEVITPKPVASSNIKPVEKVENIKANNVQASSQPVVEKVKPIEVKNTTDTNIDKPENSSNYNFNKLKELEMEKQLLEKELEIKRLREALGESDKAHNSNIKAISSDDNSIHTDSSSINNSKSSGTVSTKRTQSGVVNSSHGRKRLFTKDDFANMEPETLLRFVESFMLKNNISHNTIPESVLVEKFGKEAIKKYKTEIYNLKNKYINKKIYIAFLFIVLNWETYTRKVFRKVIYKNGISRYDGQKYSEYKQKYINNITLVFNQLLQKSEIKSLNNKELQIILSTNMLLFNMELNRIFDDIKNRHIDAENSRKEINLSLAENNYNSREIFENELESINDFNEALREIEDSILNKDIKELKEFILGCFLMMLKNNYR